MARYSIKQASALLTESGFPVSHYGVQKLIERGKLATIKEPVTETSKTLRHMIEESELNRLMKERLALTDKEEEIKVLKARLKALEGMN